MWQDCAVNCSPNGDQLGEHIAPIAIGEATHERGGGSHEDAYPGSCTGWVCLEWEGGVCNPPDPCTCIEWLEPKHPECGGSLALAEAVDAAISKGDVTSLRRLVLDSEGVTFLSERSAIQVAGCSGGIIAHVPLAEWIRIRLAE